jgi:hypothetical protein
MVLVNVLLCFALLCVSLSPASYLLVKLKNNDLATSSESK